MKAVESDQEVTNVKRSFLAMLLLFCVALTGCQAGNVQAGKYPVVADAAQLNASAQTEKPTQTPTESPTETPTVAVQAKTSAPAHIRETFTSNTGKVVINLDADVIVPEAEVIPIYQVRPRVYTDAELNAMAEVCYAGRAYEGDTTQQHTHQDKSAQSTFVFDLYTMFKTAAQAPQDTFMSSAIVLADGSILDAQARFDMQQVAGQNYYWSNDTWHVRQDGLPNGCSLSREEALGVADAAVAAFAPGYACAGIGITQGELLSNGYSTVLSGEEAWILYYTRMLELPVTYEATEASGDYDTVAAYERLAVIVDDRGIRSMRFDNPCEVVGTLAEDCTLLSFDQVMEIVRKVMPLSFGWLEGNYADVRVNITEVRLGYMRVKSKDQPNSYEYLPVWDFFGTEQCRRTLGGEVVVDNSAPFTSYFTVNAIDGTIIDRTYGY